MSPPEIRAEEAVADIDLREIENSVSRLANSTKALILILDGVSKVHSFIQPTVLAFCAVITLELNRKNHDIKVLVLCLQMADMISVLTHLCNIEDPNMVSLDGITLKIQMHDLLSKAIQDVVAFGNLCDVYAKMSVLAKAMRGLVYEERLAEFATIFANHRKQLGLVLSSFTAPNPDIAAWGVDQNDETVEKHIMLLLFEKLSSPHEKEITNLIAESGGMGCIGDDRVLDQLVSICTSKDAASAIHEPCRQRIDLPTLNRIRQELDVDVMRDLGSNTVIFSTKLELQKRRVRQEIDVMLELRRKRASPSSRSRSRSPSWEVERQSRGRSRSRVRAPFRGPHRSLSPISLSSSPGPPRSPSGVNGTRSPTPLSMSSRSYYSVDTLTTQNSSPPEDSSIETCGDRRAPVYSLSPRRSNSHLHIPPQKTGKPQRREGWWNKTRRWFGNLGVKGPRLSSKLPVVIHSPRPSESTSPNRRRHTWGRTPSIIISPHHSSSISKPHSPRLVSVTPPAITQPLLPPLHNEDGYSSLSLSLTSSPSSLVYSLEESDHDIRAEVSKIQQKLDKFEDPILESPYYEIGQNAILEDRDGVLAGARKIAEQTLASIDVNAVDESVKAFTESSQILMGALDELSKLHPFVAGVVILELKRRENDQKVIALQLLMQDMMWALLELRTVKDAKTTDSKGVSLPSRLEGVVKGIAKEITTCGNVCDTYTKKHLIVKIIKGPIYEARFAELATIFADHRKELDLALSIHTVLGIDAANSALETVRQTIGAVDEKLLLLFHKLNSPQEKEAMDHIKANGGDQCLEDDDVLREMASLSLNKNSASSTLNLAHKDLSKSMPLMVDSAALTNLRKELNEDVDESFERNMEEFTQALEAQTQEVVTELKEVVHTETDRVITAIFALTKRLGLDQTPNLTDESLIDSDLHDIWLHMSWGSTVKAPDFVQALRLYSCEPPKSGKIRPIPHALGVRKGGGLGQEPNRWALRYISVPHMQPVLDTLDSTGSGLVGIPEVNALTASRPKDWSLPRWLAYWTIGWQFSVFDYWHKITAVTEKMFDVLNHVLPANRSMVDAYLGDSSFKQVELLLHSVHIYSLKLDSTAHDEILPYVQEEETRMGNSLQSVDYLIDEANTLALITGPGWIEWHVFPVLYLLLSHHSEIIKSSCREVMGDDEFAHATTSLSRIFESTRERIEDIQSIYRHKTKEYLRDFAFGMFQQLGGALSDNISAYQSSTLYAGNADESNDNTDTQATNVGPLEPEVDYTAYCAADQEGVVPDLTLSTSGLPHLEGVWTGHCPTFSGKMGGLMHVVITDSSYDGELKGQGEDERGSFSVEGRIQSAGESRLEVLFTKDYAPIDTVIHYQGHLDVATGTIRGEWNIGQNRGEPLGPLHLGLTPIGLHRFRYIENHFPGNRARARWAFVCAAVLHQVRRQCWSWDFFKSRFSERRYFMELFERRELSRHGYASYDALTEQEIEALTRLECYLPPADQRFYRSLAQARVRRTCIHFNVVCTSCSRIIAGARVICLQCTTKDLKDRVNLCLKCIDATPITKEHVHDAEHTLVKIQRVLHDRQKPDIFRKIGFIAHRAQAMSDFLDHSDLTAKYPGDTTNRTSSTLYSVRCCDFCDTPISSPCWLCVACEKLICDSCDRKHMRCFFKEHDDSHALIRCKSTSDRSKMLEKKLLGMHERLGQLEKRQMVTNDRLTNIEELLRLVLAKLPA